MDFSDLAAGTAKPAAEVLGYLNFSSGSPAPAFLRNLNELFGRVEQDADRSEPAWRALAQALRDALGRLRGTSDAFRRSDQAEAVLRLAFDHALDAYRQFHRDLLYHQTDETLFQPFFIARVCEAVLQQGGPWEETGRIVPAALRQVNDYVGYRPVAVLRTGRKMQPYAHEWVRPIPLYVREAGTAVGRYRPLVDRALAILETADPAILFEAFFDPEQLDELAVDPRAYDFDHPVNHRPNYMFGQWDLGHLNQAGSAQRFVVQQVTLEAMLERVEEHGDQPRDERLFEAAAVLAGTMLMGAGVSGNRPDSHDSTVTLNSLVQRIARYRDAFYEQLLDRMAGAHGARLRAEAAELRQPFGGARQHFNQRLAQRRAEQLQHVHLAQVFARMGYTEAAAAESDKVAVPSARLRSEIDCRLTAAVLDLERRRLGEAAAALPAAEDALHRAIECGAMIDPWNILGFAGQFSLFPAPENSVHDHRADELIAVVGAILNLYVQVEKAAAVAGPELAGSVVAGMRKLGAWWDQFATTEVGGLERLSGAETCESADHVAGVLRAWQEAGTAAGDVAFWRGHVDRFRSPKAYALVVEALLEQRDLVASMALLVQWLSQAEQVPLTDENYSFHEMAVLWMEDLWQFGDPQQKTPPKVLAERWSLARKLLDYLEANADQMWLVPQFALGGAAAGSGGRPAGSGPGGEEEYDEDDEDDLFGAAYENVVFRDSTDDGFEGEIFDASSGETDFELVLEAERIVGRLSFLATVARLWRMAAVASPGVKPAGEREEALSGWLKQAAANERGLGELLTAVHHYRIPPPRGTHESLVEYDRRRMVKETLLQQIISASVETADAARMIRAAAHQPVGPRSRHDWEAPVCRVLHGVLRGDAKAVRKHWQALVEALAEQPLLYVALERGGNPRRIVAARGIHRVLSRLLDCLPRLGLLYETCWLIETVQDMELDHPVGPGATTEFDQVFEIGCKAIARALVASSEHWPAGRGGSRERIDAELIGHLEQVTEVLLRCWLDHSRGVRLSVLEAVADEKRWKALRRFIERYGGDLFSQRFMNMGNLRAILHEGVDAWLDSLAEEPGAEDELRLLGDLGGPLRRAEAVRWLTVAIEAVVENYGEYVDYNSTTTQSDRGDLLYTLLDFLRLKAEYDRVAWNLRPLVMAHEMLVRSDRHHAAAIWREAIEERTQEAAEEQSRRFARLVRKYGMRLPSVASRIGERFVRPLQVDRLRALVRPALDEIRQGKAAASFAQLEEEVGELVRQRTGTGFELPSWLEALEEEVDLAQSQSAETDTLVDPYLRVPQRHLSRQEVDRQIAAMLNE